MMCEGRGFLEKPRFLKTEPDKKLAVSKVASTVLRSTPADEASRKTMPEVVKPNVR
jgi:hypothetical protein